MWKCRRTQVIWSNYNDTIQLDDIQNKLGPFFRHSKTFLECIICISDTRLLFGWREINMNVTLWSSSSSYGNIYIYNYKS